MLPASGVIMPATIRSSVVFPAPLRPVIATALPPPTRSPTPPSTGGCASPQDLTTSSATSAGASDGTPPAGADATATFARARSTHAIAPQTYACGAGWSRRAAARTAVHSTAIAMQGPHPEYLPPRLVDYGTLVDMTASLHPLFGAAAPHDLSFSASNGGPLPGGGVGFMPGDGS